MFERIMDSLDDITEQLQLLRQYGEKHAQVLKFNDQKLEEFENKLNNQLICFNKYSAERF